MLMAIIRLMRPGDWVKNVFVLPALVFALPTVAFSAEARAAGVPDLLPMIGATFLAFLAFCLMASGFYAINDVVDAPKDRLHPVKRHRPVASGEIPPGVAATFGGILVIAAPIVGLMVNSSLAWVLLLYALLQASYNLGLKRVMLVDVVAVALGFALRATAGAVAIEVQISIWLALCVFFLCVYLGFIKRLCDLASAEAQGKSEWKSPAGYDDRGELNWLLGVGAVLAIVTYLMYTLSEHAWSLFGSRALGLALLSPLVMIAIHRFYRRAWYGFSDSPLDALRHDRVVLVTVVLFSAGVLATLYVPIVGQTLDKLFIHIVQPM